MDPILVFEVLVVNLNSHVLLGGIDCFTILDSRFTRTHTIYNGRSTLYNKHALFFCKKTNQKKEEKEINLLTFRHALF